MAGRFILVGVTGGIVIGGDGIVIGGNVAKAIAVLPVTAFPVAGRRSGSQG
jgi:hypothetical protein